MSTSSSTPQHRGPRKRRRPVREKLPLLQLEEWNENNTYREDPPECIRYHLGINVTAKRKSVYKDTRPNLALAPGAYWRTYLRVKMNEVVQEVLGRDSFAKATETYIVVLVKARSTHPLIQRFKGLDIVWNDIEDQLIEWSDHFQDGKNLRVEMTFKYEDVQTSSAKSSTKKGDSRAGTSATRRQLVERGLQIDAEEHSTGRPATWRDVYSIPSCDVLELRAHWDHTAGLIPGVRDTTS